TTGFGIIECGENQQDLVCAGTMKTDRRQELSERLLSPYTQAIALIRRFKPQVMVIEKVFVHYRHPTTAFILGHARGTFLCAAAACGIPVVEYSATRVKKALVGRGLASKRQVQRMVATLSKGVHLGSSLDVTDALALAIAYSNTLKNRLNQRIR
ncbi:MAG: crossover junction endodeoxyribonuclease RuvC, partial [Candidatus Omnitrophica bacterium]|nr:crossover junction endodeoxyribonuclease RuvC [Candidatus Omnitrophota bacterium]